MYLELLGNRSLDELLETLDKENATTVRSKGCRKSRCGGALHAARYRRKRRGAWRSAKPCWRESFCCARRTCRARLTPPSLRFMGRRAYDAATVVLVSVLRCGATPQRIERLRELTGVSTPTVHRWRNWWLSQVPRSPEWRVLRGQFAAPLQIEADLPESALRSFKANTLSERLILFLRWLLPLQERALSA